MEGMPFADALNLLTPLNDTAALFLLIPYLAVAFFPHVAGERARALPTWLRLTAPALLSIPYILVAFGSHVFRWEWFFLYALLPVAVAVALSQAAKKDPSQTGTWIDFVALAVLGLAVDLRWFERAWPAHLAIFNKILLLDAGIYGFLLVRRLEGVGFDLRLRLRDFGIGLREVAFYAPIALALGLGLGFLHFHPRWPAPLHAAMAWFFTFFFIAMPEELFFRGWLQNLLEKRLGRYGALLLSACFFGLAHFNKRTAVFNWRYVILAAVAGLFYGRAWRRERRVGASAITHATVDTIWSLWLL